MTTTLLQAQLAPGYKFTTYTSNDGLAHNFTKKCLQDSKGFLWIITEHGLSRFDGLQFYNFLFSATDSTGIPADDLKDIAIDQQDNIWLSYGTGLCYYSNQQHRFFLVRNQQQNLPSDCVQYDAEHQIIWSINKKGYSKIEWPSLKITTYPFQQSIVSSIHPHSVLLDAHQRLWIPYNRAKYRMINLVNHQQYISAEQVEPTSFFEDDQQDIWMTTWQTGFTKINVSNTGHQYQRFGDPYLIVAQNEYDYISQGVAYSKGLGGDSLWWVIKNTDGILLFDKRTKRFVQQIVYDPNIKNGIATNYNESIYTDHDGIIWICTWHGLTKVNPKEQQFSSKEFPYLNNQLYNCLSGVADDPFNPTISWMSVAGSGIVKYDKSKQKLVDRYFYYYNNSNGFKGADQNYDWRWTNSWLLDPHQNLWTSTYGGLLKIDHGNIQKIPLHNSTNELIYPTEIKYFDNNEIWVASWKGLCKVNLRTHRYQLFTNPSADNLFWDIERLNDNTFIVGGDKGVQAFNPSTGIFSPMPCWVSGWDSVRQQISRSLEIIDGKLYIGTMAGLKQYDFTTKLTTTIGESVGIHKISMHRLKQDGYHNLWIYTSNGLFKYVPSQNRFEKYMSSDGIYDFTEDPISFFEYQQRFHIGYRMAATSFDPLQVNVNSNKLTPVITAVLLNGKMLNENMVAAANQSFQLNYDQREITFQFTAPDFTSPDKIEFQYMLEGYDKTWKKTANTRQAVYTNLPPGTYHFKVKAANSNGIWSEAMDTRQFTIAPPFWQTAWFIASIIGLIGLAVYSWYRLRVKQLKKFYEMRNVISRNLHDEIGATLSSINIYSDVAFRKSQEAEVKTMLQKIFEASLKSMDSMSDIVWYINPQNDAVENALVRMREYALPLLEAKGIQTVFEVDPAVESRKLKMEQRQHLYLIFKEAINNILKYAHAKQVWIKLVPLQQQTQLLIRDDGIGFDPTDGSSGNGLKNMQHRATQLGGRFTIESRPSEGVLITVIF